METELSVASKFIRSLANKILTISQANDFEIRLVEVLRALYHGHWYPSQPNRASGYRCLSCGTFLDPSIREAADLAGVDPSTLLSCLPENLTVWVDPRDVSYRVGERGLVVCLWRNGAFLDQNSREPARARAFARAAAGPATNMNGYAWIWQDRMAKLQSVASLYASQYAAYENSMYEEDADHFDSEYGSESPCSSRSSSPASASPVLSEEDEETTPEPPMGSSDQIIPASSRKVSVLSRSAPEFAPRVRPPPALPVNAQRWVNA